MDITESKHKSINDRFNKLYNDSKTGCSVPAKMRIYETIADEFYMSVSSVSKIITGNYGKNKKYREETA